uniref:Putative esophageal gland cell secretory protein 5 n=1 Tax=Meloidogyne incognita TaxID=6306 RepID=Q7YW92_MELIC|nr:putative esophageal gland cell secretory protein 5 [Meloidogyne incognita]
MMKLINILFLFFVILLNSMAFGRFSLFLEKSKFQLNILFSFQDFLTQIPLSVRYRIKLHNLYNFKISTLLRPNSLISPLIPTNLPISPPPIFSFSEP